MRAGRRDPSGDRQTKHGQAGGFKELVLGLCTALFWGVLHLLQLV